VLLIMAEGLARRGHAVTLEIPHEGPALEVARSLEGVEVWLSGRPRLPRNLGEGAAYLLGLPGAVAALRRRVRDEAYDVVWVNSMFNPPAALGARLAGSPVVWHLHERNLRGPAGLPMAWLIRGAAHVAVPVSRFVAETFAGIPGGRGRQEVLFEQFPQFQALEPTAGGDFVVGFVGQFEPRKRAGDLLQALAAVPHVRGLLVGDGKRRPEVLAEIEQLGLGDRVEWAGLQRDVIPFYDRMHCVVIPSQNEPCPLVAFESMSVGRPVIASDHGGHPEVLGDAALYFPLGDHHALADAIRRLSADPGLQADLRARGLERVRQFDRESWLDDVERIMDTAADAARRS
jgi:glycosyltransferase involved in cell wall biosynthesis